MPDDRPEKMTAIPLPQPVLFRAYMFHPPTTLPFRFMPRKSGFECLVEIRKYDSLKEVPVVIFSSSLEREDIDRAFDQGADCYLCKPSSFPALKEAIAKILSINWNEQVAPPARKSFVIAG
ncbi:response regulator [Paraflavitalea pollutisoli]|uniref:response regulator n=1 Tax=Paraflavitalea pollutisoli TaxID=3034143 RepID=UPI003B832B09